MLDGKTVAVVVPAFDEEHLIGTTIAGIPELVDRVIVVDDASRDGTAAAAGSTGDPRVEVITHEQNQGVGAAILTGYRRALEHGVDVTCVMAGDNQMDPADLEAIAGPVARGEVDYAKANRLFTGRAWELIPRNRYLGNAVLSLLTKIASGYWHVADSQSGYTAIGKNTLELLDLDRIYPRYGFPNDMLVHLNVINARVRDVTSRPVYGVGEKSGIRLSRVIPSISWLLTKAFFWRMREKYVIRDFHPLVFFYVFGLFFSLLGLALGITVTILRIGGNELTVADGRPDRSAPDRRAPVHALRDAVRHGVEQGPAVGLARGLVPEVVAAHLPDRGDDQDDHQDDAADEEEPEKTEREDGAELHGASISPSAPLVNEERDPG